MYTKGINNISLASIIGISLKTNKKCLAALLIGFRGRKRRKKANNKYETCKSLFDSYSEQALNYRRLKKVNQAPNITVAQLQPIKDKILYCQKSSDLKDRAKLDTLITQRFRIQQGDKDNPYKMDI